MSRKADIVVVGAGMAGASLAAELAGGAQVILIEAEDRPGYHSTGRSAAFWSETYGGPHVQPLTTGSGPFLLDPPADFHDRSFLSPRGALHLADEASLPVLDQMVAEFAGSAVVLDRLSRVELEEVIPGLAPRWIAGLAEPSCADIDVAALHGAYLKAARAKGATVLTDSPLRSAERQPGGGWRIDTPSGAVEADLIVDAAGAWADEVARRAGEQALGIQPYRRTVAQVRTAPPSPPELPLVIDAAGNFYFKPEAGRLWLSPHDETPSDPCDCAAEELDVALAIDRFSHVVDWRVERVEHRWAGLRSFAPDRLPVYGFAPGKRDFFWFAGQGGFGIQTAPAAARLAAHVILGGAADPMIAGIDPAPYAPGRFMN